MKEMFSLQKLLSEVRIYTRVQIIFLELILENFLTCSNSQGLQGSTVKSPHWRFGDKAYKDFGQNAIQM